MASAFRASRQPPLLQNPAYAPDTLSMEWVRMGYTEGVDRVSLIFLPVIMMCKRRAGAGSHGH